MQELAIPMDLSTHRPIVDLMIDGKGPYKFIFDTGSETNVIDENLSKELGLKVVGEDPLMTPGSDNKLVSQRVAAPKTGFSGTNILRDTEMNVIALRAMLPVDGVLSGVFLADYLVTMDYPGSKLILSIGELDKNGKDVTPFIQKPRVLNINLNVAGNIIEAHLDTGSPGRFSLPISLKDKLKFKEEPKKGHTIRTPVASFERWDAELIGNISVGNVEFENPNVALVEGFETANLGYEVIKDLRTTIDRKNNLIRFQKSNSTSSGASVQRTRVPQQEIQTGGDSAKAGTYEGERNITLDDKGELNYQRATTPVLKLKKVEGGLYEIVIPPGMRAPNEIPKIRFIENDQKEITAIEMVYKDGKTDGPFKRTSK